MVHGIILNLFRRTVQSTHKLLLYHYVMHDHDEIKILHANKTHTASYNTTSPLPVLPPPSLLTSKEQLVSGDPLHHIQHVAGQGYVGTFGLGLKLMQDLSKQRVLLLLVQRLKGVVETADVLRVNLDIHMTQNVKMNPGHGYCYSFTRTLIFTLHCTLK